MNKISFWVSNSKNIILCGCSCFIVFVVCFSFQGILKQQGDFFKKKVKRRMKTHGMNFVQTATIVPENQKTAKSLFEKRLIICLWESCFFLKDSNKKLFNKKQIGSFSI